MFMYAKFFVIILYARIFDFVLSLTRASCQPKANGVSREDCSNIPEQVGVERKRYALIIRSQRTLDTVQLADIKCLPQDSNGAQLNRHFGIGTVFDRRSSCAIECHSEVLIALRLVSAALLWREGGDSLLWRVWVDAYT